MSHHTVPRFCSTHAAPLVVYTEVMIEISFNNNLHLSFQHISLFGKPVLFMSTMDYFGPIST